MATTIEWRFGALALWRFGISPQRYSASSAPSAPSAPSALFTPHHPSMKLQRTTLVLLFLALGLVGFVYFYEISGSSQRQEAKEQKRKIFSFQEDQVQSLTIKTKGQTLQFERSVQGTTKWQMIPSKTPANDAAVAYLLNLLASGKSDRTLTIPVAQLREYGLQPPQATIEVKLNNQSQRLILGKPDFNRNFLYAQANPPTQPTDRVDVVLISPDFENAVNRSLSEWKQPPPSRNDKNTPIPQNSK